MASSSFSIVAILLGSALRSTVYAVAGLDCGVLIPKDKSQGPETWQPCYSFVPPLKDILSNPHSDCKDDGNYCHGENTWSAMCKPIPEDFPMFEGKSVDMYVPTGCAGTQYDTCYEAKNFGPNLSAADIYEGDYPSVSFDGTIAGHDNSISFFVGGSFTSQKGAEVEGKIVVLGDFTIGPSSTLNSLVQVGAGSQVVPEGNQVVLTVGGDFIHGGLETANVLTPQGHVEIGGTYTDGSKSLVTKGGEVSTGTSIDTQTYLQTFEDLAEKSAYWSTLYPNGRIIPAVEHQMQNVITFAAGDDDCLQVFHVD